ncbi:MAG: hypothetical protein E6J39_09460, partial [Chloroflexi bacterium]
MVVCGMLAEAGSRSGCSRTMRPCRKARQMSLTSETAPVDAAGARPFGCLLLGLATARQAISKGARPMHGHRNPSSRPSMLIAVVAVGLILAACGANTGSSAAASGGTVVKIVGLAYDPTSLTVNAGTMVTFQNNDTVDHTLTNGKDGKPDANPLFDKDLPVGKSETVTFSTAGTFNVTCK